MVIRKQKNPQSLKIDKETSDLIKSLNLLDEKGFEKMSKYVILLLNENKKYNLISKNSENVIWHRHVLDSLQIVKFVNFNQQSILHDLGSGGFSRHLFGNL